MLFIHASLAI